MTKKFLLEQCRRSRLIDEEENANDFAGDSFWLTHNKGHKALRDEFEAFLNPMEVIDIKELKKWIKDKIKANEYALSEVYERYETVTQKMTPEDELLCAFEEGKDCMANLLIRILRKEKYLWRNNY